MVIGYYMLRLLSREKKGAKHEKKPPNEAPAYLSYRGGSRQKKTA